MANVEFADICQKKYSEQAIWFLNGFWARGAEAEAEIVWAILQKFVELDPQGGDGNELSEFDAHKFLELVGDTMTILELRNVMREIDTDANGQMALIEYLIYRYGFTPEECAASPQGGNQEEIDKAQAKFEELSAAVEQQRQAIAELEANQAELAAAIEATEKAVAEQEAAAADLAEKIAASEAAVAALQEAIAELQAAEDKLHAAEAELNEAIATLNAEEEAYHGAIATAEAKANDESLGVVSRNRAKNELAQLQGEDPMPLRRAKLTQEAALRKVGKEKKVVQAKKEEQQAKQAEAEAVQAEQEAAKAEVEAKKAELEQAKADQEQRAAEVEEAKQAAEVTAQELEQKSMEASAELEELKAAGGIAEGVLWYLERVEVQADAYKPSSKQKFPERHRMPPVSIKVVKEEE